MTPPNKLTCTQCNKNMIKRYSETVLLTNPPLYPWYWWCGCGHTDKGGFEKGEMYDPEAEYRRKWEQANG